MSDPFGEVPSRRGSGEPVPPAERRKRQSVSEMAPIERARRLVAALNKQAAADAYDRESYYHERCEVPLDLGAFVGA